MKTAVFYCFIVILSIKGCLGTDSSVLEVGSKDTQPKIPASNHSTIPEPNHDGTEEAIAEGQNKTEAQSITSKLPMEPVKTIDLSKPGVLKRAILVFGGFGLIAILYFMFYRWRSLKNGDNTPNNPSDSPSFRYGVLNSEDRMELSRMPLTMESDEDDEEDLEIFDLGEKKRTMHHNSDNRSAVEDIMASVSGERNEDHLLLDIDSSPAANIDRIYEK